MKKYLITLAAVFCCTMTTQAQTQDLSQYFSIDSINFRTIKTYTIDFAVENYSGTKKHAGIESLFFDLKEAEIPEQDGVPATDIHNIQLDTLTALLTIQDTYGREYTRFNFSNDVRDQVNDYFAFESGYWGENSTPYITSFNFMRGGEYNLRSQFDFIGIDKQEAMTIYDEPSLRINPDPAVKIGSDANIWVYFNTGYPYDINSLTGEEYATITLYKQLTDTTAAELSTHQYPLHLKDEAHPLVAGIDSLHLLIEKPELGKYLIHIETNWDAVEARDLIVTVRDTLRATATLNKQTYDLATERNAQLHIKMDYGYPHIYAIKPDTIPTIRIYADLLKAVANSTVKIFTDSLLLESDTLATKDLKYEGDWMVDLTNIKDSMLTEEDSTFLQVTVIFNGGSMYEAQIPLKLTPAATGITTVTKPQKDDYIYTLNGIRVSPNQQLAPGIYIRKGRKVIIKNNSR